MNQRLVPIVVALGSALALPGCSRQEETEAIANSACVAAGPAEVARWVYEKKRNFPYDEPNESFLSQRLHDLLVEERKCEKENEGLCSLGANPWINAQDGEMLPPIVFELASSAATSATVRMSYKFGWADQAEKAEPAENRLEFVFDQKSSCWLLDDLVGREGVSLQGQLQPHSPGA